MSSAPSVTVVTVTYGDRGLLCESALKAALRTGVHSVVIVLNGSTNESRARLSAFADASPCPVTLVEIEKNRGSADAFTRGMEEAEYRWGPDFLWLLDDDNAPASNCLDLLLRAHGELTTSTDALIFARRQNSSMHSAVLTHGAAAYPPPGAFMYFDVAQRCARVFNSRLGEPIGRNVAVPYGPYGGLLIPRQVRHRLGMPRADYVLYEDDTEYTARAATKGIGSFLCVDALIQDLEPNWLFEGGRSGPERLIAAEGQATAKVYYSTRNRIDFERSRASTYGALLRFCLNGLLYLGFLMVTCVRLKRAGQLKVILSAMARGLTGSMGPVAAFDLCSSKRVGSEAPGLGGS